MLCSLLDNRCYMIFLIIKKIFSGTHHHKSCNEVQQANVVRDLLTRQASNLFPSELGLDGATYPPASRKKLKPYGGWGDIRDHQLCMKFTQQGLLEVRQPT